MVLFDYGTIGDTISTICVRFTITSITNAVTVAGVITVVSVGMNVSIDMTIC